MVHKNNTMLYPQNKHLVTIRILAPRTHEQQCAHYCTIIKRVHKLTKQKTMPPRTKQKHQNKSNKGRELQLLTSYRLRILRIADSVGLVGKNQTWESNRVRKPIQEVHEYSWDASEDHYVADTRYLKTCNGYSCFTYAILAFYQPSKRKLCLLWVYYILPSFCYHFFFDLNSLKSKNSTDTTTSSWPRLFCVLDLFHGRVEDGHVDGFDQHRRRTLRTNKQTNNKHKPYVGMKAGKQTLEELKCGKTIILQGVMWLSSLTMGHEMIDVGRHGIACETDDRAHVALCHA